MRRRTSAIAALVSLAGTLVILAPSSPAAAQTGGYPPAGCNVLRGSQSLGNVAVGQRFSFRLSPECTFTPGVTVTIRTNGVSFTKRANADGAVELTVTVNTESQFEINPTVPATCGPNTITGTGLSAVAGNREVTQDATFNLVCRGGVPVRGTPARGRLSVTGSNVAVGAAAALVLLLTGATLVTAGRRRASARG